MCKILTERGNKWRSQTTLFFESTNVSWHKSGAIDRGQVILRWGRICVIIKPKSQKYFLFFYVDKMGANAIVFKRLKNRLDLTRSCFLLYLLNEFLYVFISDLFLWSLIMKEYWLLSK